MLERNRNPARKLARKSILALALGLIVGNGVVHAQEGESFDIEGGGLFLDDTAIDNLPKPDIDIPFVFVKGFLIAQGDMVLGEVNIQNDGEVTLKIGDRSGGNALYQKRGLGASRNFDRWPDGIVPYQFDTDVTQIQRDRAMEAVSAWNRESRMLLVERTSENAADYDSYIQFEASKGCASYVGRVGGDQSVWISDNCTVGSIIHEVGHAIGLFHEHTRPDRDQFITVNTENIKPGREGNFAIVDAGGQTYGDHDYGSIMHYGAYFFSQNGEPTISAPDGIEIGQREALSPSDISTVNNMYATDISLKTSISGIGADTEIDVVITNEGGLGANTLVFTASMGPDAKFTSVSANSGWSCLQFEDSLRCTRDTLEEDRSSQFSVRIDAGSATASDLKATVVSRTLDTDLSNNAVNDTVTQDEVEAPDTAVSTGTNVQASTDAGSGSLSAPGTPSTLTTGAANGGGDTPNVGAGNSDGGTGSGGGSAGGGGSTDTLFGLLLLASALLRRRVLRT